MSHEHTWRLTRTGNALHGNNERLGMLQASGSQWLYRCLSRMTRPCGIPHWAPRARQRRNQVSERVLCDVRLNTGPASNRPSGNGNLREKPASPILQVSRGISQLPGTYISRLFERSKSFLCFLRSIPSNLPDHPSWKSPVKHHHHASTLPPHNPPNHPPPMPNSQHL